MKKRLVSSLLAMVMLFVCTAPSFAAPIEPRDRYRTVVETDPYWTHHATTTITYEDAKDIERVKIIVAAGLGAAATPLGSYAATIAAMAGALLETGNPGDEGTYIFEKKNRITYYESMSTGERQVHRREVIFRITFQHGDYSDTREYSYTLR